MQIYRTVVGNNAPNIAITVQRNSTAIDVTGATVKLVITNEATGSQTNSGHETCSLTTPASGIVTYVPVAGDFTAEGRYVGEIFVTYSGGTVERIAEKLLIVARAATT